MKNFRLNQTGFWRMPWVAFAKHKLHYTELTDEK